MKGRAINEALLFFMELNHFILKDFIYRRKVFYNVAKLYRFSCSCICFFFFFFFFFFFYRYFYQFLDFFFTLCSTAATEVMKNLKTNYPGNVTKYVLCLELADENSFYI